MKMSGNTILIIGGTSGVGREFAHDFHTSDNKVVITGRREGLLDDGTAAHPGMISYVFDVDDGWAIRDFAAAVAANHPKLNVLLTNARIMKAEDLTAEAIDVSVAEATITTNLLPQSA